MWLLALATGCNQERVSEPAFPPITANEASTGRAACASYAARVCRCETSEEEHQSSPLGERCELAKVRGEALEVALGAADTTSGRPEAEQWAIRENARRIIRGCVEADLELDPQRCPRTD